MPLDYNAKLSDIIAKLRDIEGINSRADLISVVGTPATEGDTIADINSVIQTGKNELAEIIGDSVRNTDPLLELIGHLGSLKRFATGVTTSGASTVYFKDSSGTNRYATPLTVTGLSFRPTTVLAYFADGVLACVVSAEEGVPKDSYGYHRAVVNTSNLTFRVDGEVLRLINGEFNIPVVGNDTQFHWIAIG